MLAERALSRSIVLLVVRTQDKLAAPPQEKFLKAYVALIFGDRTAPPRHIHEALAPLISTFTPDEFGTYVCNKSIHETL